MWPKNEARQVHQKLFKNKIQGIAERKQDWDRI